MGGRRGNVPRALRQGVLRVSRKPMPRAFPTAEALLAEYRFLVENGCSEALIAQACQTGADRRIAPHLLLVHQGAISPTRYLELLQGRLAASGSRTPDGITEIVDVMAATPAAVAETVDAIRTRGNAALLLVPQQIDWSEPPETRRLRADAAANGLLRRRPEASAGNRFATWQLLMVPLMPGLVVGALLVSPEVALAGLAAIVTLPFLLIVGLRVLSLIVELRPAVTPRPAAPLTDAELPVYSIIVPLFREAEVVPGLVDSLCRLDYPPARLDVLLVTESIDSETQAALRALALPPHMRVLVVPDVAPRTKPKALNYALSLSRGEYVVVYDAEDDPEPDQLRRAQTAFREGSADLMCVQARLALYNHRPGWIARQFMLEYATLFDALLPALVRLGIPVPLGGTSNHFPRSVLEQLGGWDAHNVTEDADLGMRIARAGGRVLVLDSTTWEEAPERLAVWLPQRTRWMKGFMQTWLVHMRRPRLLWRELGPLGFVGFNALLGGIVMSALIHPIFVAALAWGLLDGKALAQPDTLLGNALLTLAMINLVGGYASGMALAGLAASRRRILWLIPHLLLMPLYWLLISVAAYRAVVQLVTRPYLWEKTPHSARRSTRRTASGVS